MLVLCCNQFKDSLMKNTSSRAYLSTNSFPSLLLLALYCHVHSSHSLYAYQFSSVAQSCPTLCDPVNHSTPGLPVHHQLPEFTQTHVHQVRDAIQPSHPLSSPSPPAPKPSHVHGLPWWFSGEKPACQCKRCGLDPWVRKGEGNGNPLQYSGLENSMDRGVWQATVHGVTKSQIRLSD